MTKWILWVLLPFAPTFAFTQTAEPEFCSPEIPLMQFGGINTGRYQAGATPGSTHIYGWPMNNYWTTNFNAYQLGGHTWSYSITGFTVNHKQKAARAGQGNRIPFLARILPGCGSGDDRWQGSLISGWTENTPLITSQRYNDNWSL